MKHNICIMTLIVTAAVVMGGCKKKTESQVLLDNPFMEEWNTPYGVPPFDKIKPEHYLPAFEEGMKQQNEWIDQIVNNSEEPTFGNTIIPLEYTGHDGRGGRGGGGVRLGEPDVEGRQADLQAEADEGAEEGGEKGVRPVEEHAREHERARARVAREEVDPGRPAGGLFAVLEGDEPRRGKAHRLPGEEERQLVRRAHDGAHGGERGGEEEPEARKATSGHSPEVACRMQRGGGSDCEGRCQEQVVERSHG